MKSGLIWSIVVSVAIALWVLVTLGGYQYYTTPVAIRAYADSHRLLRPSGPLGQSFGMAGTAFVLVPFVYMARKRVRWMKSLGTMRVWLEAHLFSGVVGPVLITFHAAFKFNGIVSAAYWSMMVVTISGFVGRYLYVRVPRSIRGNELTQGELDARVDELKQELAHSVGSNTLFDRVEAFDRAAVPADAAHLSLFGLVAGELTLGYKARRLARELAHAGLPPQAVADVTALTLERAVLLRRIAYLQKTKKLFGLWHVFHTPFAYVMIVIVGLHIGVTLYMGYIPFRW